MVLSPGGEGNQVGLLLLRTHDQGRWPWLVWAAPLVLKANAKHVLWTTPLSRMSLDVMLPESEPQIESFFHLELLTLEIDATCDRQMVLVQPDRCRCRKTLPTQDVSIEGVRSQMGWMDRAGAVDDCRSNKALPSLQVLSSS